MIFAIFHCCWCSYRTEDKRLFVEHLRIWHEKTLEDWATS